MLSSLKIHIAAVYFLSGSLAQACELINGTFAPVGRVVTNSSSGEVGHRPEDSAISLALMLRALIESKASDPKSKGLQVEIDPTSNRLTVTHLLDGWARDRSVTYDVTCVNGYWQYQSDIQTSADGAYRKAHMTTSLKLLSGGHLEVINEDTITRGFIFRSQFSVSTTGHFEQIKTQ